MNTPALDALRDALTAARPAMTGEQQDAADALLAALTPPMEEPTWPGAVVMARCSTGDGVQRTHARRNDPSGWWECTYNCQRAQWEDLIGPRPLTAEERAKYGIPSECEPITDELVERCIEATDDFMDPTWSIEPSWVRAVLRAAGHPEADR